MSNLKRVWLEINLHTVIIQATGQNYNFIACLIKSTIIFQLSINPVYKAFYYTDEVIKCKSVIIRLGSVIMIELTGSDVVHSPQTPGLAPTNIEDERVAHGPQPQKPQLTRSGVITCCQRVPWRPACNPGKGQGPAIPQSLGAAHAAAFIVWYVSNF